MVHRLGGGRFFHVGHELAFAEQGKEQLFQKRVFHAADQLDQLLGHLVDVALGGRDKQGQVNLALRNPGEGVDAELEDALVRLGLPGNQNNGPVRALAHELLGILPDPPGDLAAGVHQDQAQVGFARLGLAPAHFPDQEKIVDCLAVCDFFYLDVFFGCCHGVIWIRSSY